MPLDRYDKIHDFRGVWGVDLDRYTAAAFEAWEDKLGTQLHILQGSYRPYTSYSGGTHTGGGALDVWAYGIDPNHIVKVGRDVGFACWWRHPWQGDWTDHVHGIEIGNVKASDDAKWQVAEYKAGNNGLHAGERDSQPYRPSPIREFNYKAWEEDMPLTREEIDRIANAVWNHEIKNPLTPGQDSDKIDLHLAINKILNMVDDIKRKTDKL